MGDKGEWQWAFMTRTKCDVVFCYHNSNDSCDGSYGENETCHVQEYYNSTEAELTALKQRNEWRDIESAPKSSAPRDNIIACFAGYIYIASYCEEEGRYYIAETNPSDYIYINPTHWMPLPTAPDGVK